MSGTTATKWYFRKGFLLTVGAGALPFSFYSYDRYKCKEIHGRYMNVAKTYGQVPLPIHQLPLKITILAEGRDRDDLLAQNERFMSMVQPLLTAAGVDYEWLECSRKKHAVEYVKRYQEKPSTDLDGKKETLSTASDPLPTEESAMLQFKGITEWRLVRWLENDMMATLSLTASSPNGRFGFLSRLASWFWPFSSAASAKSCPTPAAPVPVPSTAPIVQDLKSEANSSALSAKMQLERALIEQVKEELVPRGATSIFSYQQGMIAIGTSVFQETLEAYRLVRARHPKEWDAVFDATKMRTGYLPIPTVDSNDSRLLSRLWRFFNNRHDMLACSEAALGIISDSLEIWTEDHDKRWPSKYEPSAVESLVGKVVFYKSTQLPTSSDAPR